MAAVRSKTFEYDVSVDADGRLGTDGTSFSLGEEWTADHLLLAAVLRCSIVSLAFHARRMDVDAVASGEAAGTVAKPDDEERHRFVEITVRVEARLDPLPDPDALAELLAKAERDCFVGSSLKTKPIYDWRIRG